MPRRFLTLALLLGGTLAAAETRYFQPTPTVPGGIGVAPVDPASLPASAYVSIDADGHLILEGQRARFWAVIGGFPNQINAPKDGPALTPEERRRRAPQAYADNEALITRFQDLGFNMARFWRANNARTTYTPGDGSSADVIDHFVATAKAKGFRLWMARLNHNVDGIAPDHVSLVDDPATAEAWKAAVGEAIAAKQDKLLNRARIWDRRLEAYAITRMVDAATHVNQYTGLRWCDDPVFAAFELSNEEWWIRAMLRGDWQKLPEFFRESLFTQWHDFLRAKYGDNAGVTAAWKTLLPGEDLAQGTIAFAPMAGKTPLALSINDAAAHANAAATGTSEQSISPADVDPQRGSDVLEFLIGIQIAHKQREAAVVKDLGRATRSAPLAYDTGIGYEIQSAYLHQHAEVTVHDAYINGTYPNAKPKEGPFADELQKMQADLEYSRMVNNRGKWVSWLEKPPGISQGVPWLEHNKVVGKPFFAYETQIQQPAKYRADYPLRVGALAAIQDWDIVCWHYWGGVGHISSDPRPFDRPMDVTTGSHPQGYHYTYDEVQNAMMRAAGYAFRGVAYTPAPSPTTFIYGRKSLLDPVSMRYAGSYGIDGMDMLPTTYQHGVRIRIDPDRDDDAVEGPVVKAAAYETHNPYTPTAQITFDWKRGFLAKDSPAAKTWTGFLAKVGNQIAFADGTTLSAVTIANPDGIYEPIGADEGYIAFSLYSEDGLPLSQTRRAACSLVSTSFNTGFSLGVDHENGKNRQGGLPVLVARVGGTITCPAIDGMRYVFRDWHLDDVGQGTVTNGVLTIPTDRPVFYVELSR